MPQSDALLAFEAGGERLSIQATRVREIAGLPRLTRVPGAPAGLAGVANIRGAAIPILSVAHLRGRQAGDSRHVIVLAQQPPVGLLVDGVLSVQSAAEGQPVDPDALIAATLRTAPKQRRAVTAQQVNTTSIEPSRISLLGFALGNQEFALPVDQIQETLAYPASITPVPQSDAAVLGTIEHRGQILPVFALATLLAIPPAGDASHRRVIVARIQGRPAGLAVDSLRSVLRIEESDLDPVPAIIARRSAETRISAICRMDGGQRLVSVLDSAQLLRDLETEMSQEQSMNAPSDDGTTALTTEPFVLFQIDRQSFGLPVNAVEEIVNRPERLTKVPKAPAFVEGVMNLRGRAIPVIDQRRRFNVPSSTSARDRILIVGLGELRAGFVVDDIKGIVQLPDTAITAAPQITDGTRTFDRVANLDDGERLLLLVDPAELLNETEQQMLTALSQKAAEP